MAFRASGDAYLYDQAYLYFAAAGVTAIMLPLAFVTVLGRRHRRLVRTGGGHPRRRPRQAREHRGPRRVVPRAGLTGAALLMTAVVVVLQRILTMIDRRGRSMAAALPTLLTPRSD